METTQNLYHTHPAAEVFPLMGESDLKELTEDIRQNGLREPIITFNGKVLDGRNRLLACERAGVEPRFREFPVGESVAKYVWSANYVRRHLTTSQRAMAITAISGILSAEAKIRMSRGGTLAVRQGVEIIPPAEKGRTRDALAMLANVSNHYISDAKLIDRESPDLAKEVLRGNITIPEAKRRIQNPTQGKNIAKINNTPDLTDDGMVFRAMLMVVDIVMGTNDISRRCEIMEVIYQSIKLSQLPSHQWITMVNEHYTQGVLRSHAVVSMEPIPPGWTAVEPYIRILNCKVMPIRVSPVNGSNLQTEYIEWEHDALRRMGDFIGALKERTVA